MRNKIIFMLLLIFSFTLLVGCNLSKEPTDPTQTVDNSVRVKFYVDDEIYSSKKHDKGSEIKLPEDPVKEGYKFIGWYTEDGDIISKKFIVEEALNIYAKFEEIESTIKDTYIVNFYIEEKLYYSIEVEKNNKIPGVEDPMSPTGYYFYGWVDDNNKEVSLSDKVNSNLNLHAVFYPILEPPMQYYEVYYYVEGGLYSIETYEPGIYITPSFEPYLSESYQFIGWFDEYGNQYYGGYIYENISLYAEFKEITYEVRYYVDGSLDKVENYQKGSYIDYLYTPTTPYNYNFVGWFDEYGNQYYCGYIYSNINLYAKFEEIIPFTYNEYDSYIEITGYIGTDSNVIIPDYINGKPVTHVASNFQGNSISNIKTLKIGKNISYIENGAFSFGKGLESVYCDSIEYWLNITFNGYTANPVYCDAKLYVDGQLLEHVEIPSHITEIKPYTFILSTLKTINLNNVITIGELAFYKSALTELYLPASVRNIGLDTFSLCTSLVKIDVDYMNPVYKSGYLCINSAMPTPANTIIEKSTGNLILGCSNSHITSDVTNISYGSLSNFMAETLYIPSTVTSIDQSAFLGMQSTIDVYYNGSYEQWISITGNNIYFKNVYYDYQWTYKDNKFVTDVLFNGNVYYSYVDEEYQIVGISRSESIGDVVDLSLHFDTRFSIDLDIVHIENMFNKNIYQFIIDKNTSSIDIKNYFYGYPIFYYESNESDWNNVLLSDNVIDYFFVYYYSEVQPTQDGYYWHYDEFGQPAIWDELIIPTYNGFTYIEYEYYIEITGYIGNSDVVEIPTEINGMPVISIADNSFEGCNFKELIIPSIINDIGNNILRGCDNLEKLTIPYYVNANTPSYLCDYFDGSGFASSANYPSNFKELYINYCDSNLGYFLYESNIETLILGNVWSVDYCSFANMTYLDKIVITSEIMNFSNDALSMHSHVKILLESHINSMNYANIGGIMYSYTESQPTDEGNYWHYDEFGNAVIWDEYTHIHDYKVVFEWELTDENDLDSLILTLYLQCKTDNSHVDYSYAFADGYRIDEKTYPTCTREGILVVEGFATYNGMTYSEYKTFTVDKTEHVLNEDNYCIYCWYEIMPFTFNEYSDYIEITGYFGNSDVVEIPAEINGKPVTTITDYAFKGCNFKELYISNSVTYIGNSIVSECDNLEKLTTPFFCSKNTNVLASMFGDLSNYSDISVSLKEVTLTNIDYIVDYSFYCSYVEKITLADNTVGIGDAAFKCCDSLKYIDLKNVTRIANNVFYNTYNLEYLIIPNTVDFIGEYAFAHDVTGVETLYPLFFEEGGIGENYSVIDGHDVYLYSELEPSYAGNYWHYVDGIPTIWKKHIHNLEFKGGWGTQDDIYYAEAYCTSCSFYYSEVIYASVVERVESNLNERGYIKYEAIYTIDDVVYTEYRIIDLPYAECNHSLIATFDWDNFNRKNVEASLSCEYCIYNEIYSPGCYIIDSWGTLSMYTVVYEASIYYGGEIYTDTHDVSEYFSHDHNFGSKCNWGTDIYDSYFELYCNVCGMTFLVKADVTISEEVDSTLEQRGYIVYMASGTLIGVEFSETYTQYLDYAYCNHYFTLNTDWDKIYNCYVIYSLDCAYCIYSYNSSVCANVIEYTSATADSKGYISYEVELNYNGVIYRDSYSEILEATDHIHVFEDKSFWGTQDDIYYHDSYCTGCGFALHKTVYAYEVERVEATQYENGYIIYQVEYELDGLVYSEFRTVTLYYK